jgi:hypothetical protein
MQITKNQIICILLLVAVAIQAQQYFTWGHWFDFDQIHHEVFSVALVFAAVVVYFVGKKKVKT